MYKSQPYIQIPFKYFNQLLGLHMNPENRWVEKAGWLLGVNCRKTMQKFSQFQSIGTKLAIIQ